MAGVREHEKIAREIEKTSESIHKKHRALKTGRIEEDIALDRHFKLIIKFLQQIVELVRTISRQSRDNDAASKCERKEVKEEEEEEEGEKASETFERSAIPCKPDDRSHDRVQPITSTPSAKIVPTIESLDNVFETTEDSLATKVQNRLQTSKGVANCLGSAGSKVEAVLRGTRDKQKSDVDYVYGTYTRMD